MGLHGKASAPVVRQLPSDRARWRAELDDLDAAFRDLDDSLTQRELRLAYAAYFADLAPLRKDPRHEAPLERMGVRYRLPGARPSPHAGVPTKNSRSPFQPAVISRP